MDKINELLDKSTIHIPVFNNNSLITYEEKNETTINDIINNEKNINNMLKTLNLSEEIILLYKTINNPGIEYVINDWVIKSLNEVIEHHNIMKEFTNKRIIDLFHLYVGMGHYHVIAYEIESNTFFIRRDGGSNGYDREENFSFICNYDCQEKKHFDFNMLINILFTNVNIYNINIFVN